MGKPSRSRRTENQGAVGCRADQLHEVSQKIYFDGKVRHLGCFDTKQQEALAYDREAMQRGEEKPLGYGSSRRPLLSLMHISPNQQGPELGLKRISSSQQSGNH
jgi:hypothetical protein